MNAIVKPKPESIFKNEDAKEFFSYLACNSSVYEWGIDADKRIYIAWLNGCIDRYTRKQFIKKSAEFVKQRHIES